MKKKLRYYPQHPLHPEDPTMETCGAACVVMLLDLYDMLYPTLKMERMIYSHCRVNGYKGITGAAIANCLSNPKDMLDKSVTNPEKTLDVHLVQSFEEKMDNCGDLFSQEDYKKIMESHLMHLKKCKERIRFSPGEKFDCEFLIEELKTGKMIILECFIPEQEDEPPSVLHWVILENYDDETGKFRIRDPNPNVKLLHLTAEEVKSYMDTPIGHICIAVGEKTEIQEAFR